jgi:hypothetical protein
MTLLGSMRRHPSPSLALLAALLLPAVACGGGGGGGPGGSGGTGGGMIAGGGTLTWLDDGVRHNATVGSAAFVHSAMMDLLQMSGGEPTGIGISFGVAATPPLGPTTVPCNMTGTRPFVSFSYTGTEPVWDSCSVTVSTLVLTGTTRVTGVFEAVFPKTGGGTTTLSSGTYDLPLTVSSI